MDALVETFVSNIFLDFLVYKTFKVEIAKVDKYFVDLSSYILFCQRQVYERIQEDVSKLFDFDQGEEEFYETINTIRTFVEYRSQVQKELCDNIFTFLAGVDARYKQSVVDSYINLLNNAYDYTDDHTPFQSPERKPKETKASKSKNNLEVIKNELFKHIDDTVSESFKKHTEDTLSIKKHIDDATSEGLLNPLKKHIDDTIKKHIVEDTLSLKEHIDKDTLSLKEHITESVLKPLKKYMDDVATESLKHMDDAAAEDVLSLKKHINDIATKSLKHIDDAAYESESSLKTYVSESLQPLKYNIDTSRENIIASLLITNNIISSSQDTIINSLPSKECKEDFEKLRDALIKISNVIISSSPQIRAPHNTPSIPYEEEYSAEEYEEPVVDPTEDAEYVEPADNAIAVLTEDAEYVDSTEAAEIAESVEFPEVADFEELPEAAEFVDSIEAAEIEELDTESESEDNKDDPILIEDSDDEKSPEKPVIDATIPDIESILKQGIKELRAYIKELGYKNTSTLTLKKMHKIVREYYDGIFDYEQFTRDKLMELCAKKQLSISSTSKREDIINALKENTDTN